jgi:hypothetical protein
LYAPLRRFERRFSSSFRYLAIKPMLYLISSLKLDHRGKGKEYASDSYNDILDMSIQEASHRSTGQGLPGECGDDEDRPGDGRVKTDLQLVNARGQETGANKGIFVFHNITLNNNNLIPFTE